MEPWARACSLGAAPPSPLHDTSFCSGAPRGPHSARAEQTLPNTTGHSKSIVCLHAGAWWPLTEMASQPGDAKRHQAQVAPLLGPRLSRSQSAPVLEAPLWAAFLWVQGAGSGRRSGWQGLCGPYRGLRAGGGWQPVLVPGSRAHLRAGCHHPGWEHCKGSQGGGGGS